MSQYSVNLTAGQERRIEVRGQFFMIRDLTNGAAVDVHIEVRGQGTRNDETFEAVKGGFKARIAGTQFDAVRLKASANCTMRYVISDNAVDFDFFAGADVNATVVAPNPLPVSNDRGAPGTPVYVAGITYADAPATSAANVAALAASAVQALVVAANANRKSLRITNQSGDDVAIGANGITWANRCIVLKAGDTWVEERGANLAWYCITDAAKAATVSAQEVLA